MAILERNYDLAKQLTAVKKKLSQSYTTEKCIKASSIKASYNIELICDQGFYRPGSLASNQQVNYIDCCLSLADV